MKPSSLTPAPPPTHPLAAPGPAGLPPPRAGLTLIELLVVVAIIGVLSAILIPAVGMLRQRAGLAHCTKNLQQLGMACLAYAYDHHSRLPAEGNKGDDNPNTSPAWFYRLPPYMDLEDVDDPNSVFQCPEFAYQGPRVFNNASPKSYKMNGYLDSDGRPDHYRLNSVPDQSEIVLMITAKAGETGVGQWGHCTYNSVEDAYHGGLANVLMLDCQTIQAVELPKGESWKNFLKWESDHW